MSASSGGCSTKPLDTISHDEAKYLLLNLGCEPFSDGSDFNLSKTDGGDLVELESADELTECGVITTNKLRLKKIFTALKKYKKEGVPVELLAPPDPVPPAASAQAAISAPAPASASAPIVVPMAAPQAPAPAPEIPIPEASFVAAPQGASIANAAGQYSQTIPDAAFRPARTPQEVDNIINKLVKDIAAGITGDLLECAYTSYFPTRPNNAAVDLWMKAYKEREQASVGSTSTCDEHHKKANDYIEQALQMQFWLPLKHACLWSYAGSAGSLPSIIYRLEYDALWDIFNAMQREGQPLTEEQKEIQMQLSRIFHELSKLDGNGFRLSIRRNIVNTTSSEDKCLAGCFKVTGQGFCYCCVDHFKPRTGYNSSTFSWDDYNKFPPLFQDVRQWDPSILFYSVVNWPAADPANGDVYQIWCGSNSSRKKFFDSRSNFCAKFPPFPKSFLERNDSLFGNISKSMSKDEKLDVCNIFAELIKVRNRFVGHGGPIYNTEDLWWTFTFVLMATHVIVQQATTWLDTHEAIKNVVAQWFPTPNACQRLKDSASVVLNDLSDWDDVLKSSYNSGQRDGDVDYYREFVLAVNKFRAGESFLILLMPPLAAEFIPSSLAAVPWDLVIDFADLGVSANPTNSIAWQVLKHASSRDGVVKDNHKVSFNASRIFRKDIDALCNYLSEVNPLGVPWWQLTSTLDSGLLSNRFDEEGRTLGGFAADCEEILDAINTVVKCIFDSRVLQNRSVQIVIPMYGVYEMPCYNPPSSRWFFRTTYSAVPTPKDRNFAVPFFMQWLLRSLTNDPKVNVKCTILHQLDSTLAPMQTKMDFLSSDSTGLRSKCVPQFLMLPIELMMLRYRMSFMDDDEEIGGYNDAFCIFKHRSLVPFANYRLWDQSSPGANINDIRAESKDNIIKLKKCGIDLLHNQSPEYSLREFESKSFFSMLLNDNTHKQSKVNPLSKTITKQALALFKFYFSYPPAWALFCKDTMAQDRNLFNPPFVAPREALFKSLRKKAEILKHGRTTDNTLIVMHKERSGGTTLVRNFAWTVAFKEWHSVVLVLDERLNSLGHNSFLEAIQILRTCLEPGSDLVIIADRNVLSDPLKRLCDEMKKCNFHFLLIRLQRLSGSIHLHAGTSTRGEETNNMPATANLSFQTYGKVETLIIDLDAVENRQIEQDMDAVVGCMFRMVQYFDPVVNLDLAWKNFKEHGLLEKRFKKILFLGLLRFVEGPEKNTSATHRTVYRTVISKWMEDVVGLLYTKIEREESFADGYTTASAVRALMYIALIQMCSNGSLKLGINSLRIVFNDPTTAQPLFSAWESHDIELIVLSKAFNNAKKLLDDRAYANFTPVFGSLLPFIEFLQQRSGTAADEITETPPERMFAFPVDDSLLQSFSKARETVPAGKETADDANPCLSSAIPVLEEVTDAVSNGDLDRFPPIRQFRAVKNRIQTAVNSLASPDSELNRAVASVLEKGPAARKDSIHNMSELLAELLTLPPQPSRENESSIDQLDDISDLLWGEFLDQRDGKVSFVSNDVAEIFLEEALRQEERRYRQRSTTSTSKISQLQTQSTQLYILAMSLLHTIGLDRRTTDMLRSKSFVDIQHEEVHDTSLAWCAQHIFNARQFVFEKEKNSPSGATTGAPASDPNGTTSRSASTKYVPKYQRWSWLMEKLYFNQDVDDHTAGGRSSTFQTLEMKLLVASQAAYSGFWRLSSVIVRLMQYHLWNLTDDIAQMRARIEENVGTAPVMSTNEFERRLQMMYSRGVQLYLASTARMILAFDEINRTPGVMNNSEEDRTPDVKNNSVGDRKKFSGTMDQLGNCIKAFICLNRETLFTIFSQVQQVSSSFTLVDVSRSKAVLTKFYGCSACLLIALGNMARYFYGLSIRIVAQPLGFGDEIDGWLHVLEGLQSIQRAALQASPSLGLDLRLQPALAEHCYEVMKLFCGERGAQWIKGAGPILYDKDGQSRTMNSFDELFGKTTYYSTHIYSVSEIHDQIYSKLADYNEANMRALEEKNTDFSYFDQNLSREDLFIVRLADIAANGYFKSWKHLFDENRRELNALPQNHELIPFKERSMARFAQCMWQQAAMERTSFEFESISKLDRIISSRVYHRVMVEVNQDPSGQDMVEAIVRALVHCVSSLTEKYPLRLMTQLVELLSFVSADSVLRVIRDRHGDLASYLPYTVELLMPIVEKWESSARQDLGLKKCDETSLAAALRFRVLFSFLILWKHAANRGNQDAHGQYPEEIKFFNEYNGYFDSVNKVWKVGILSKSYKAYLHNMERYVFVHPMQLSSASTISMECTFSDFGLPLCLRRQFSIIEEGIQERKLIDGHVTAEEKRYCMQLVHGVISSLFFNEKKNRYEGSVTVDHSKMTLPFYYDRVVYDILEMNGSPLMVEHPCTFYVSFLPWRIEAHAVQCSKTAPTKHQSVFAARVPTDVLYVGEKKMKEVAKNEEKRGQYKRAAPNTSVVVSGGHVYSASESTRLAEAAKPIPAHAHGHVSSFTPASVPDASTVSGSNVALSLTPATMGVPVVSAWSKKLELEQDPAIAAEQEATHRMQMAAQEAALPVGVSFVDLFRPSHGNAFSVDRSVYCHHLDDPLFGALHTFRPDEGTPLRQVALADLYEENLVSDILTGAHHDEHGVILPPLKFRRQLYGYLTLRNEGGQRKLSLFSPYKFLTSNIPDDCGVVSIPNYIPEKGCCLPCSDEKLHDGVGGSGNDAFFRILVRQASSNVYDESWRFNVTKYGSAEPRDALSPKVVQGLPEETIPSGPSKYHRRLFLLWHLHSMSLLAVREGLLVLVAETSEEGKHDWSRLSLGVVYFSKTTPARDVVDELEDTWKHCKQRLFDSDWKDSDKIGCVQPPRRVKFTAVAANPKPLVAATATTATASHVTLASCGDGRDCVRSLAPASALAQVTPVVSQQSKRSVSNASVETLSLPSSVRDEACGPKVAAAASVPALAIPAAKRASAEKTLTISGATPSASITSEKAEQQWNTVIDNRAPRRATEVTRLGSCTHGLSCIYGASCRNGPHPPEVERVFGAFRDTAHRQQFKMLRCIRFNCNDVERCKYYHAGNNKEKKKAFCSECLREGHLHDRCPHIKKK